MLYEMIHPKKVSGNCADGIALGILKYFYEILDTNNEIRSKSGGFNG